MRLDVKISNVKPESKKIKSIYADQLYELSEVRRPYLSEDQREHFAAELSKTETPTYVELPWLDYIIECVGAKTFFELKTNRNQLLIKKEEQLLLGGLTISIAGMSVGSSALYGLIGTGIGGKFNIADDDRFSTTNLNRVPATLCDVGEPKVEVAYRRAKEMNPFIEINCVDHRIDSKNIDEFAPESEVDLIVEEIDDVKMKIGIREHAKKIKKPVIMLTNVGDSIICDVERYDSQEDTDIFNGLVGEALIDRLKKENISPSVMMEFINSLIASDLMSPRVEASLSEIGATLAGRPQLYSTVAIDGGLVPYLVRKIFLDDIGSGRYILDLPLKD